MTVHVTPRQVTSANGTNGPFARWLAGRATARAASATAAWAIRDRLRVAPADASVACIGHFGQCRDQFQSTLWARVATLLQGFQMNKETA